MPPDLLRALENKTWDEASPLLVHEIARNSQEIEKVQAKVEAIEAIVNRMQAKLAIFVGVGSMIGTAIINSLFQFFHP